MRHKETLRERHCAYLRRWHREERTVFLVVLAAGALLALGSHVVFGRHMSLKVLSAEALSSRNLSGPAIDAYYHIKQVQNRVREQATAGLFRHEVLPVLLVILSVIALGALTNRYAAKRLLNTPALARHAINAGEPYLKAMYRWHIMSAGFLTVLIVGILVFFPDLLKLMGHPGFFRTSALLLMASVMLLTLSWLIPASRRVRLYSPLFVRRQCCLSFISVCWVVLSLGAILATSHASSFVFCQHMRADVYDQQAALATHKMAVLDGYSDEDRRFLLGVIGDVSAELERFDVSALGQLDPIRSLTTREAVACAVFVLCYVVYVTLGPTLMTEFRRPWIPLLATPLAAVVIDYFGNTFVALYGDALWLEYLARLSVIGAAIIFGQIFGVYLKRILETARNCPRCSFPVDSAGILCTECGTRVDLLARGKLIGNIESRELHDADCPHARRMLSRKKRVFADAEQAYWDGFDNCGSCLGGSLST